MPLGLRHRGSQADFSITDAAAFPAPQDSSNIQAYFPKRPQALIGATSYFGLWTAGSLSPNHPRPRKRDELAKGLPLVFSVFYACFVPPSLSAGEMSGQMHLGHLGLYISMTAVQSSRPSKARR